MKAKAPCKNCTERAGLTAKYGNCHNEHCSKWVAYKDEFDTEKATIYANHKYDTFPSHSKSKTERSNKKIGQT